MLTKIDKFLAELLEFNKAIVQFDAVLTGMDSWINGKGQVRKMHGSMWDNVTAGETGCSEAV